jgi:tetratricopeptide (TPR) repeat protein
MLSRQQQLYLSLLFFLLLATAAWAFHPGLGGDLIFDDVPNLLPWKGIGDIDSLHRVLTFISSGTGFPGRPLSLLSFLVDDQSWPPDTFALKRTNLAIHLVNSCLIFWLSLKLMQHLLATRSAMRRAMLALFVTTIWTLHPIQVSNVSYIIQRMNLLSTTLELAGMILFISGRERIQHSFREGLIMCSMAIGLFMPVAILAKENGLLLCVFALLIEGMCFQPAAARLWRPWKAVFLWTPIWLFIAYCLVTYRGFTTGFAMRDFNAWERLLTQGPVIVDYLHKLLLPHLHGSGLFFDNFPISHSLISPPGTLFSWLALAAIGLAAWRLRKTLPLFSFGIFFYFCGHLMESTVLPLEIYFEHRNYLPQAGIWLALASLLDLTLGLQISKVVVVASACLAAGLAFLTHENSAIWSNSELQAAVWYNDNPDSLRTTLSYANVLIHQQNFDQAYRVIENAQKSMPDSLILSISRLFIHCYWQDLPTSFAALPEVARRADYEVASVMMLERMRAAIDADRKHPAGPNSCTPASAAQIAAVYEALLSNPRYSLPHTRARLFEYLGDIASSQRNLGKAIYFYDQAFAAERNPTYPYRQAMFLLSAGLPDDAERYMDLSRKALTIHERMLYPDLPGRLVEMQDVITRAKRKEK